MSGDTRTCPEEEVSHGVHGVVKDAELLASIVLFETVGDDSLLTDESLTVRDFIKRDGWSFVRVGFADMQCILNAHAARNKKKSSDYGYALVKASDIRGILYDKKQSVCVIDDPLPFPEHALGQQSRTFTRDGVANMQGILSKPSKPLKSPSKMPSMKEQRKRWKLVDGMMVEMGSDDDD